MSELNFFTANAGLADVAKLEVPELKLMYRIEMAGELFYNILADRVGNETAADRHWPFSDSGSGDFLQEWAGRRSCYDEQEQHQMPNRHGQPCRRVPEIDQRSGQ